MQVAHGAAPLEGALFAAAMAALGPFETKPALAVAISGGPDSMALALLAKTWVAARGGTLVALTVDHGLRPESASEARMVGRWLKARGIPHRILRWGGPKPKSALQSHARAARYALLTEHCRRHGILHLLLGHQREDQAETLLMRLERGSRLSGLAAMPQLAERDGVRLLRPLLALPRARLVALLDDAGQSYVDDPSNHNPAFGRVRHRASLATLERDGFGAAQLADLACRLGALRHRAEIELSHLLARSVRLDPAGYALIALKPLESVDDAQVALVFGAVIATIGGEIYAPAPEALDRLVQAWRAGSLGRGRTLGGCQLVPKPDHLIVCREAQACAPPIGLAQRGARWDSRFDVAVKALKPGHRGATLGALGVPGIVALRRSGQGDWLARVPAPARRALPVFRTLEGRLSTPHLNFLGNRSVTTAGGFQPILGLRPRRRLAEAPFSGTPAPVRVASA